MPDAMDGRPSVARLREHRLLSGCLLASLALHALALAWLPSFLRETGPPAARVLDVVLVQPEPLPVAPPDVEPQKQQPRPAPARAASRVSESALRQADAPPVVPLPLPPAQPETQIEPAPVATQYSAGPAAGDPTPKQAAAASEPEAPSLPTPPVFNAGYLRNPPPRYPLAARRNGEQGTVMLRVLVSVDGVPASVSVEKTSGSARLDHAARDTVSSWRFVPARRGAQLVEAWVLVPIVFRLEGAS